MKWGNLIQVSFHSIAKNKMRSLLTMLGIIIGVGSVIALMAVGKGSQVDIQGQIASLGTNMIMIMAGSSDVGGVKGGSGSLSTLTMKDAHLLQDRATLVQGISPEVRIQAQVVAGAQNWNTSVSGVWTSYLLIRNQKMASGTFFSERDMKTKAKVAVLGKTVADELFPGEDPVGARIRIRNVPFKVVGVLAAKGQNSMGMDQDDLIVAPAETVLYRLSDGKTLRTILASASSAEQLSAAKEELSTLLRASHRLDDKAENDFTLRDQTEIQQMATSITSILTLLLSAIAGVSLLVGGIGIMNIMLVSVTERTREIGIRMAIGARGSDVLVQFLIEAVTLSLLGGVMGILVGLGLAYGLGALINSSVVLQPTIVALAVAFTAAVGIFFGFYPARKAANLNPIEALRYE